MTAQSYQTAPELAREHLALSEHALAEEVARYREMLYRSLDVLHDTLQSFDTLQGRYERLLAENRALRGVS
jgi:hypothetical protein